ncbi:DUF3310 domain-containing protein [Chromatium okenii]|jgi:hypothetical protein|uniref:DUF3310 domain-containing protein n=1 Tax=Chromatium okenii TaxID=61644 RepID=UPI0026F1C769|nr:DUF3310 domain-containing protein [Chromatium okenii]MBV5310902.1 DUF3310 domain-containing protein [Chromatium okenii]
MSVFTRDDLNDLLPPDLFNEYVKAKSNRVQIAGDHYTRRSIQPWDALKDWLGAEGYRAYLRGNAVKYLCRAGTKGDVLTDIKKAHHYLSEFIETYQESE